MIEMDCTAEIIHKIEIDHTAEIDHMTEIIHTTEIEHMTEINHTIEVDHTTEIDHILVIYHEPFTEEMTIEKKTIGISNMGDIEINMDIIMKTGAQIIIEMPTKIETKTKTGTELIAMTKIEVGLKENIAHMMMEKIIVLPQNLKDCTKVYNC